MSGLVSRLSGGLTRAGGFLGSDKFFGLRTNYWKPLALGLGGATLGIGALSMVRPTYNTEGGAIVNQSTGGNWMDQMMGMIMPIMMLSMMLPMMSSMAKNSNKDDKGDN